MMEVAMVENSYGRMYPPSPPSVPNERLGYNNMPIGPYEPPPAAPNWLDLNWIIAAIGGFFGALTTGIWFVWNTSAAVADMRAELLDNKRRMNELEEHVERRHSENDDSRKELIGELRNTRQTLESSHRDLTRRIDDYMSRH